MKRTKKILIILIVFLYITSLITNVFADNIVENTTQPTEGNIQNDVIETVAEPVAEENQEKPQEEPIKEEIPKETVTYTETINTENTKTTKSNNNDDEAPDEEELSEKELLLKNANLKELTIKGYNIEFDSNKYMYSIEVDKNQNNLDITTLPDNEKATVVIENNENLDTGKNKIIIKVTSEDETTVKEYIIYATKDFEEIQLNKTDDNTRLIIMIACGASFIICFIIFICKTKK